MYDYVTSVHVLVISMGGVITGLKKVKKCLYCFCFFTCHFEYDFAPVDPL